MASAVAAARLGTRSRHPVDEILRPERLAVYGVQHVLAFYAGAVVVPLLLAGAIGLSERQLVYLINADLFTCGIASIIQSVGFWKIGVRLPLLQGVTFTAVGPMITIGKQHGGGVQGLLVVYGAVIVAGVFTFLVAPFFSRLIRLFPPVVTGTVITIIGITLIPVAAGDAAGGVGSPDFGSGKNLAYAGGTLLLILLIWRFLKGFLSTIAVLIGLVVGTLVAYALGDTTFRNLGSSSWFGVTSPFHYGAPQFKVAAVISMVIVMLITMVETTGDVFATGEIVDKPIRQRDIARALRADGLATTLGGILNSFPYTCFAENVGLVRLTRVKSRYVVAAAGVIMMIIGVIPKGGALVAGIPPAVLGGAALAMFATVAVIGIQTLSRVDFHDERNVVVVAISLALAMIPVGVPNFYHIVPQNGQILVGSGITSGSLAAILLNLVFNVFGGKRNLVEEVLPTGLLPERLSVGQVNHLGRDDFVATFGTLFQGSRWVAETAWQRRPFDGLYSLRHAFLGVLFDAPAERQLELIRSYPELAGMATMEGSLGPESIRDQASAGLDRMTAEEYEEFHELNAEYEAKFGFPLVVCVRENTKETILASARARLRNVPAQEKATALIEIAKIANLRLLDLVDEGAEPADGGQRPTLAAAAAAQSALSATTTHSGARSGTHSRTDDKAR